MEKSLAVNGKIVQIGRSAKENAHVFGDLASEGDPRFLVLGRAGHGNYPNATMLIAEKRIDMTKIIYTMHGLDDTVKALQDAQAIWPGRAR